MDWTILFDEPCGGVTVTTRGRFDVADHARMVADIVSREEWTPGRAILFDNRQLDFTGTRYAEMLGARDNHVLHERRIGNARSAILMNSEGDYGIGRQFQLLAENAVSAELRVFIDERSALEWLCARAA